MKYEEILALLNGTIDCLAASDIHTLSLETEDVTLRIERKTPVPTSVAAPASAPETASVPAPLATSAPAPETASTVIHDAPESSSAAADSGEPASDSGTIQVKSPVAGTFYVSLSPDSPPFVAEGSWVSKGDTLCILEAMKMMNEVEAEQDGFITRIMLQNGDLAECGQALFEMKTG